MKKKKKREEKIYGQEGPAEARRLLSTYVLTYGSRSENRCVPAEQAVARCTFALPTRPRYDTGECFTGQPASQPASQPTPGLLACLLPACLLACVLDRCLRLLHTHSLSVHPFLPTPPAGGCGAARSPCHLSRNPSSRVPVEVLSLVKQPAAASSRDWGSSAVLRCVRLSAPPPPRPSPPPSSLVPANASELAARFCSRSRPPSGARRGRVVPGSDWPRRSVQ